MSNKSHLLQQNHVFPFSWFLLFFHGNPIHSRPLFSRPPSSYWASLAITPQPFSMDILAASMASVMEPILKWFLWFLLVNSRGKMDKFYPIESIGKFHEIHLSTIMIDVPFAMLLSPQCSWLASSFGLWDLQNLEKSKVQSFGVSTKNFLHSIPSKRNPTSNLYHKPAPTLPQPTKIHLRTGSNPPIFTLRCWFTFKSNALQAPTSKAFLMRLGLVTSKSSPTICCSWQVRWLQGR